MKNTAFAYLCLIPILGLWGQSAAYKKISASQAQELMDGGKAVILDVRTPAEFAESRVPGAVLLPDYEIETGASRLLPDKGAAILVYCRTGRRSAAAAKKLVALGYTAVYDFGGIVDWKGKLEK